MPVSGWGPEYEVTTLPATNIGERPAPVIVIVAVQNDAVTGELAVTFVMPEIIHRATRHAACREASAPPDGGALASRLPTTRWTTQEGRCPMGRANGDETVAGVIVTDGKGHFFAIGWSDLQRHRVPAGWVPAVAAAVAGGEPVDVADVHGCESAVAPVDACPMLIETVTPGRMRLASQRLAAWLLFR